MKLLNRDKTNQKYSNTESSKEYLVSTSPTTINGYIDYNNQSTYVNFINFSNAIRENAPQWKKSFEIAKEDKFTFNSIYRDEHTESMFMSGMHGLGLISYPYVVAALNNIQQFKTMCDLGGATGTMAVSACKINPNLEAIIYDLPHIGKHTLQFIDQTPLEIRNRIRFQGGDFFVDPIPQVDLYGLGRILHDWTDEQCHKLLTKVYQNLPETNGAVLIGEKLFDEDKTGPLGTSMQDINMLACNLGRERSVSEFTNMLKEVGFKNIKCQRTGAYLDAIIGYK